MREKEITGSLESAVVFVECAMDDLKEERSMELDLNIWKALESIEYAAFLLSLENSFHPEVKTRFRNERVKSDEDLLKNTLDFLREGIGIADLSSDLRILSRCVRNARRLLLLIQRNRIGRSRKHQSI